ncbi:MAG: hypothetical protein ACKVPX_05405 [Myxococcaceae bacterium]
MSTSTSSSRPMGARIADAAQVPRDVRKSWASGLIDTVKGALYGVSNSGRVPMAARVAITGGMMLCLLMKSRVEGVAGDDILGTKLPDVPDADGKTPEQREPNAFAELLGKTGLTTPKNAQLFLIQLCVAACAIGAVWAQLPSTKEQTAKRIGAWTSNFFGPVFGLLQGLGVDIFTRPLGVVQETAPAKPAPVRPAPGAAPMGVPVAPPTPA